MTPEVKYKGRLKEVLLTSKCESIDLERLLNLAPSEIQQKALSEETWKPVKTLYHLTDCEEIKPFPMEELKKWFVKKGTAPNISSGYNSSHALVKPRSEDTPG